MRDGNGSDAEKQALYSRLSPEAQRYTPTPNSAKEEVKQTKELSQSELQDKRDTLMQKMWSDPNESTQQQIYDIDDQLENRFDVKPLYKKHGDEDLDGLKRRREKLMGDMLTNANENTQNEIRGIDDRIANISSPQKSVLVEANVVPAETPEQESVDDEFITNQEFREMLEQYGEDEFDNTDEILEQASQRLKDLKEKYRNVPLTCEDAERLLLVENAKLNGLSMRVTEYLYSVPDQNIEGSLGNYAIQASKILQEVDMISQNVTYDTSNTPENITFIKSYSLLQKELISLHTEFMKYGGSFSGTDFTNREEEIIAKMETLFSNRQSEDTTTSISINKPTTEDDSHLEPEVNVETSLGENVTTVMEPETEFISESEPIQSDSFVDQKNQSVLPESPISVESTPLNAPDEKQGSLFKRTKNAALTVWNSLRSTKKPSFDEESNIDSDSPENRKEIDARVKKMWEDFDERHGSSGSAVSEPTPALEIQTQQGSSVETNMSVEPLNPQEAIDLVNQVENESAYPLPIPANTEFSAAEIPHNVDKTLKQELAEVDALDEKEVVMKLVPELNIYQTYEDLPNKNALRNPDGLRHALIAHVNFVQNVFNGSEITKENYQEEIEQRKEIYNKEKDFFNDMDVRTIFSEMQGDSKARPIEYYYFSDYLFTLEELNNLAETQVDNLSDEGKSKLQLHLKDKVDDERRFLKQELSKRYSPVSEPVVESVNTESSEPLVESSDIESVNQVSTQVPSPEENSHEEPEPQIVQTYEVTSKNFSEQLRLRLDREDKKFSVLNGLMQQSTIDPQEKSEQKIQFIDFLNNEGAFAYGIQHSALSSNLTSDERVLLGTYSEMQKILKKLSIDLGKTTEGEIYKDRLAQYKGLVNEGKQILSKISDSEI